jgi:hypothetical protein
MDLDDFKYRQQVKDRFVTNVLAAKKQIVLDNSALLENV